MYRKAFGMLKPSEYIALNLTISLLVIIQLANAFVIDQSNIVRQSNEHTRQVNLSSASATSSSSAEATGKHNGLPEIEKRNSWTDSRRPVWNMAHMVNSIKELDYRLGKGANAIEVDVTFGRDGDPLYTYHGPPCDCWRHCHQQEDFHDFLKYVREITTGEITPDGVGQNLTLMLLDLKLDPLDHKAKAKAGVELAKSVVENLYSSHESTSSNNNNNNSFPHRKPIGLILSINHVTDVELVHHFLHQMELSNSLHMMSRIGFDVGMNDDLQMIESMWKRVGSQLNLWQGDGFTNCFSPFYNLERLTKALQKRDQEQNYPRKVYQWTIDMHDRMREALRLGVDAVMTNHPERLLVVLQEPDVAHNFRLATRDDDPFKKIIYRANSRNLESARHQRSASQSGGGLFGGLMDILSSWLTWVREIPYLSLPTTSRFMPSSPKRQKQAEKRTRPGEEHLSKRSTSAAMMSTTDNQALVDKSSVSDDDQVDSTEGSTIAPITNETQPYEGPKWYTSLASNLLISAMKVVLPADS